MAVTKESTARATSTATANNNNGGSTPSLNGNSGSQVTEKLKMMLKRYPNSFLMEVKCPGCQVITTTISHSPDYVFCVGCQRLLCQPTSGQVRLTAGCTYRSLAPKPK